MTEKEKNLLTTTLLAQTVAGARNVKPMERLEALHNDIGAILLGEKPTASWALTGGNKRD
ncbi:uncharacterized protein METZ01_LOCUS441834 [marine metagenome]|uniref:Uncharacterized protein n=1 Tax=marine metagenome TaxID=408172 RepID=A0A382Z0X0_9ZZZZ|tara:strand:- start:48 stop:227 length:180 start_codon:yes stop_codon:yes gene_type:complete